MHSRKVSIGITIFTSLLLQGNPSLLFAQDSCRALSLAQAIQAVLKNSKAIQLAEMDEYIAHADYKQTDAIYLPQVSISYSAISSNNPLNAFGFKLEQKTISQNDFNPDLLNHPAGTADFSTKLELDQPLLNVDLIYRRKAAEKQKEVYRFKTERTKEFQIFETEKAYLQLQLSYAAIGVLEDALQTNQNIYKFTNDHYKQGLIQKSDVLNAEVQVATVQTNLAKAKSTLRNASDQISLLMGNELGIVYKTDSGYSDSTPDTDTILNNLNARSDFIAMQKAIEASDLMIKSSKMSYLPKLNGFGMYQLNDSRMLGFGANSYFAGLQLSWQVFKGNSTRHTILTQKLERDKLSLELSRQKEESQLEINKTTRELYDAESELTQKRISIEQAKEALQILQNRYQQGLVNSTDVLMAATALSQQKFGSEEAIYHIHIAKAYMHFLKASNNH